MIGEFEIIGDKFLPIQVYRAGKKVNWSLREEVIDHMLFEGGARASEVIELTIGDYRARKSFQEAATFNKGSHGKRIKFIRFCKDTTKLHSKTFKQKENSKGNKPTNHLDLEIEFRKLKPDRNLDILRRKYMKLSKQELVQRPIQTEQYIAENENKWVSSQFESFK